MCVLRIFSDTDSFKSFALGTKLEVVSVHDKDEIRKIGKKIPMPQYQISLAVSDRDWDDFPSQVKDAIVFLSENFDELAKMQRNHKVDDAYLDFPIESRLDGDIVNQNDHLPRQLIALAGKLNFGIEISIYG